MITSKKAGLIAGVSRQQIEKDLDAGKIIGKRTKKRGAKRSKITIDEQSVREYYASKIISKTENKKPVLTLKESLDNSQPGTYSAITKLSIALNAEKHKKLQIENSIKEKKLLSRDECIDTIFDLFKNMSNMLQSIPDKTAIKVRSSESDHEATQILKDEIHRILSILSDPEKPEEGIKKKIYSILMK